MFFASFLLLEATRQTFFIFYVSNWIVNGTWSWSGRATVRGRAQPGLSPTVMACVPTMFSPELSAPRADTHHNKQLTDELWTWLLSATSIKIIVMTIRRQCWVDGNLNYQIKRKEIEIKKTYSYRKTYHTRTRVFFMLKMDFTVRFAQIVSPITNFYNKLLFWLLKNQCKTSISQS